MRNYANLQRLCVTASIRVHFFFVGSYQDKGEEEPLRLPQKPNYRSHLRSGERLGILLVALGYHGWPHAAREVHLLAEAPQGAVIVVVGVIHLGELAKAIRLNSKSFHRESKLIVICHLSSLHKHREIRRTTHGLVSAIER